MVRRVVPALVVILVFALSVTPTWAATWKDGGGTVNVDKTSFVNEQCGGQIPITVTAKTPTDWVAGSLCEWSTDGQAWKKGSTACFKGATTSTFTTQIVSPSSGTQSFTLYVQCREFGHYNYNPFAEGGVGVKNDCDLSDSVSSTAQLLSQLSMFTFQGTVANCHVPSFAVVATKPSIELDSGSSEQAAITINNNEGDRPLTCTFSSEVQSGSAGPVSQSGSQQFTLSIIAPQVKKAETKNIDVKVECTDPISTLKSTRSVTLSATYKPTTGGVSVSSTPVSSGAEIKIDGISRGVTPKTVEELAAGSYTLEVYYKGYKKETKTISIVAGKTETESISLTPILGSIRVESTPPGATVNINGERGKTPITVTDLPVENEYTITLRKEGFKPDPATTKVRLTETKTSESISVTLEEKFSGVSVNFRATKSAITLNEEAVVEFTATNRIGNPTLKLQLIPKVPSGFTISGTTGAKSGAGQFSNDFEVKPGDSRTITLRIKPEQTGTAELTGEWTYFFEGQEQDKVTDKQAITLTATEKAPSPASATPGGTGGTPAPAKSPGFEAALGLAALLAVALLATRRR